MVRLRGCCACWLVCVLLFGLLRPAIARESTFPFGSELVLDAAPMHGSKRVPILQIDDDGAASIDLWCASVRAQATVAAGTITIAPGPLQAAAQCTPESQGRDEQLLTALSQATAWRRSGDLVELIGVTTLRFHLMTN